MTDIVPAPQIPAQSDDVQSMRTARKGPAREGSLATSAGSAVLWVGLLLAGALSVVPIAQGSAAEFSRFSLVQASDGVVRGRLAQGPGAAGADELEILSELSLLVSPSDRARALELARDAVAKDPARPFVWARVAWLETESAGKANDDAAEAIRQSAKYCLLCDEELIRWRFNFVLGNWNAMPEDVRRKAFEQADILRWRGENAEFLAEMRVKANQAGIPYDAYRSAVDTPVRTRDLGPAQAANP